MNEKSLTKLEFDKVKEMVKKYALSEAGKELIENISPYGEIYEVKRSLNEVREALKLIDLKGNPPFEGLYDVRAGIERAGKGGILTAETLLKIASLLRSSRLLARYVRTEEFSADALNDLTGGLTPLNHIEDEITRCINDDYLLNDEASSQLSGIRKSLRVKQGSLKDKVGSLVRTYSKYLQENLYTVRGDRYVIPVRSEFKGQVRGLIHDQSSSGQTLFIEPMELVNLNNELKELMLKEKAEIERILRHLSSKVENQADVIKRNGNIVYQLDAIFAKARYADVTMSVMPEITENGSFDLKRARHPLIDEKKVVPSDIYMKEGITSLIITGPNTGGKTVTLKTVGLLHVMALSGLLIPAEEGSEVSFFREIYADIGDEQSIEQSLSTFSSHMTNIVGILDHADENDLVLFDELGAGTDPTEGAALAMAILEDLKSRGTRVVATTHYSELKAYAMREDGVENASCEFDVNTLKPTYRLLIGIPGKSNAFLISKRLGLSDHIIEKSKNLISDEGLKFEDLIEDLQVDRISAREDAMKVNALKKSLEDKEKELKEKLSRIDDLREKQLENARHEARNMLKDVKEEADEILKSLRKLDMAGNSGGTSRRKELEESRQRIRDAFEILETGRIGKGEDKDNDRPVKKIDANPGESYYHKGLGQAVTVITRPDSKGDLMVQAGIMKITANVSDLTKTESEKKTEKRNKKNVNLNLKSVPSSIDLRGLDGEEAAYRTDMYLDEAAMAGMNEVTIIHGVGTGILKKRISELLRNHPHVRRHRRGEYGEGGMGVTIVEVK